jgi:hypothetical protein
MSKNSIHTSVNRRHISRSVFSAAAWIRASCGVGMPSGIREVCIVAQRRTTGAAQLVLADAGSFSGTFPVVIYGTSMVST